MAKVSFESVDIENNVYFKNNPQYFIELLELAKRGRCSKSLLSRCTRKEYKDYSYLRQWIDEIVPNLIKDKKYGYNTRVYWVLFGLTDFPKCHCCGKTIERNVFLINEPRYSYCNNHCQVSSQDFKDKRRETWNKHFGVDYPTQAKCVINTRHQNNIKKYGVPEPSMLNSKKQKMNETRRRKNNGKWESAQSALKRKQTNLQKYGNTCSAHGIEQELKTKISWQIYEGGSPLSDPAIRKTSTQTMIKKYGCQYFAQSAEYKQLWLDEEWRKNSIQHQIETKRKNNSFHISKQEAEAYKILVSKYGTENVLTQYESNVYPFRCDFYIKSLNLYIECNFTQTHGFHWFNPSDKNDVIKLELWKSKHTKYYDNAIQTWTIRDPEKRRYAIQNNLNYKVYWSLNELKQVYL